MPRLRRLLDTFRTARLRGEIDRELAFHLRERIDELQAQGVPPDEAVRWARLQFGNPSAHRERTRDVDVSAALDTLLRNVRVAARALRRTPGFTIAVVLTLALGIGANSAVFSAVDGILFRPLPYLDADRLVRIDEIAPAGPRLANVARITDWNRLATTFEIIAGYTVTDGSDTTRNPPEPMQYSSVTPGFFDLLGIAPALGRHFTADDHRLAGPSPILLSHRLWRQGYGADPETVGATVRIRDVSGDLSFPVAGVMPDSFRFLTRDVRAWSPLKIDAPWFTNRGAGMAFVNALGRLKPGVTLDQARADLARVQAQLGRQYPRTDRDLRLEITPLKDIVVGSTSQSLWMLFAAVSVLLLIACTNIAALQLARAAQREQEIAMCCALGATRRTVVAQLVTEAAVLAAAGAAAGAGVAVGAAALLRGLVPDLPRLDEVAFDGRLVLYTAATTVLVVLICGVLPARRSARRDLEVGRAAGTRTSSRHATQWLLVGVQVSLAVALLAGAGLLLRSLHALERVDRGFDGSHVLALKLHAAWGSEQPARILQRVNRTLEALESIPGVETAATTAWGLTGLPATNEEEFRLPGTATTQRTRVRHVSPDYFATLSIPLRAGVVCPPAAPTGAPRQVLVNRRFAERFFPGRTAIGDTLLAASGSDGATIIGVVENTREWGIDHDTPPTLYACNPAPNPGPWFLVRTTSDPGDAMAAVRLKLRDIEPLRAVYDMAPLDEHIAGTQAQHRMRTIVLTLFAATALALSCVGVYGTLSYVVRLRRREVGLRIALGAARGVILRQFMGLGLRVAGVACLLGLALALGFTRTLAGMLYGVPAWDPLTLAGTAGLVLTVAALATVIPAARAALLQPMRTLRDE